MWKSELEGDCEYLSGYLVRIIAERSVRPAHSLLNHTLERLRQPVGSEPCQKEISITMSESSGTRRVMLKLRAADFARHDSTLHSEITTTYFRHGCTTAESKVQELVLSSHAVWTSLQRTTRIVKRSYMDMMSSSRLVGYIRPRTTVEGCCKS